MENLETENLVKNSPFQIGNAKEEKSLLKTTGVVHSAVQIKDKLELVVLCLMPQFIVYIMYIYVSSSAVHVHDYVYNTRGFPTYWNRFVHSGLNYRGWAR